MRNIKLVLEYDGSSFFGFQKQLRHPTIQEELEKALSKLLNRKTKIRAASGRTDTGVHAA
ncbi:MAG TPA: tRNA pseudouridine(38-40) synthase TruA, partial [bacterium]|nr:tRNA pseudouridine(38-40) synthase TruA [bacterium]